jgi:tripartite-type tricarboxylate transporter receptor subunit TctC
MKPMATLAQLLLLATLSAFAGSSSAQQFPERPVRLIVPFAAGGAADIVARAVGERLGKQLGQTVIVENKPGAGATIGADFVAKSTPDGYTLLYGTPGPQIVNPYLMKKLPYDPMNDFSPITPLVIIPNMLVVHPSVPAKSVKELIELAKAQPGKINYGSAGIGASSHLSGELFRTAAGIQIVHVPYKGTGAALQDLLAGNIQMAIDSITVFMPYLKSGTLRALAVSSLERSPLYPELPVIADTLPGFDAYAMNYITTSAGTPRPIIDKLNRDINAVLKMPDLRERLISMGATPTGGTPEELARIIRNESEKWRKVIEISGAKPE